MKMIKFMAANTSGRDFVMGDLHGCLDQLDMFLKFINFDYENDRMFSVGDLVDRGPDSWECLDLLNNSWFHAVKGNHEELMEDFIDNRPMGLYWFQNGGDWWRTLTKEEKNVAIKTIKDRVAELPLLITVAGEFHVLHAELRSHKQLTDADLADLDTFLAHALEPDLDGSPSVTWGRNVFSKIMGEDARTLSSVHRDVARKSIFTKLFGPKLSPIYSGHTPVQMPTKIGGQINLDTCAFFTGKRPWCGLTFTEPKTGKFWKVTDDVNEIELVTV